MRGSGTIAAVLVALLCAAPARADDQLEPRGRVFLRETAQRGDPDITGDRWTSDLTLDSARIGIDFETDGGDVHGQLEADMAGGDAEVVDAYVELRPDRKLRVKAGRFKVPFSAVALASKWELPVLERGFLNDASFNTVELPLGGRAEGAQLELRLPDAAVDPSLAIGAFRTGVEIGGDNVSSSVDLSESIPVDAIARAQLSPTRWLDLAVSGAYVSYLVEPPGIDTFRHGWVGGLDATVRAAGIRAWLELFVGRTTIPVVGDDPFALETAHGVFVAGRAIVGWRARKPVSGVRWVEPYASGQALDASTRQDGDRALEIGGGVNLSFHELWRIQTGVEHRWSGTSDTGTRIIARRTVVGLQLAARFR